MKEQYCTECGEELIEKELDYLPWYMRMLGARKINSRTGEKNTATYTYCPNGKWYNSGHTSITSCSRF